MNLITTTENSLETKILNFEHQLFNATYFANNLIINNIENILPYLVLVSLILGFLSCFLPCILCKTIKEILLIPCRCLKCIICRRKSNFKKLQNIEIDSKEQKLIAA
jgi:hypothetical protein